MTTCHSMPIEKIDMDPLPIMAAAGSLAATTFALVKSIGSFVTIARNSRAEIETVSQDLVSLQVCLEVLESDRRNGILFGSELEVSVGQVLVDIDLSCGQIESMLAKLRSTRVGQSVQWATQQKDQMTKFRSSLQTHKSALQMALQLNTISLTIRETRSLESSRLALLNSGQANATSSTLQQINQKVDRLTCAQDSGLALQRTQDAMTDLLSIVKDAVTRHEILAQLAQQCCRFADESVATVQHTSDLRDISLKLKEMSENPFADPFDEVTQADEDRASWDSTERPNLSDTVSGCLLCSSSVSDSENAVVQTRLLQLKADWRREWVTQLKQELRVPGLHPDSGRPGSIKRDATNESHGEPSSTSDIGDVMELLSEVMTVATHDDDYGTNSISEMSPTSSTWSNIRPDLTNRLQRLQSRYDSIQKRNQILIEEISDLRNENLELRDDISRLQDLLSKVRAMPSRRIQLLQREHEGLRQIAEERAESHLQDVAALQESLESKSKEIEDLRHVAEQATEKLEGLERSYKYLLNDQRKFEIDKANSETQELASLRSEVLFLSQEIENLRGKAENTAQELIRLQALEALYNNTVTKSKGIAGQGSRTKMRESTSSLYSNDPKINDKCFEYFSNFLQQPRKWRDLPFDGKRLCVKTSLSPSIFLFAKESRVVESRDYLPRSPFMIYAMHVENPGFDANGKWCCSIIEPLLDTILGKDALPERLQQQADYVKRHPNVGWRTMSPSWGFLGACLMISHDEKMNLIAMPWSSYLELERQHGQRPH